MNNKLYRSQSNMMIGGVCGGLGDFFGVDPTWIRLFFVLASLSSGLGLLTYLVMWVLIPVASESELRRRQVAPPQTHMIIGAALLGLGLLFLLQNLNIMWWGLFDFSVFWPLLLIIVGGVAVWRTVNET